MSQHWKHRATRCAVEGCERTRVKGWSTCALINHYRCGKSYTFQDQAREEVIMHTAVQQFPPQGSGSPKRSPNRFSVARAIGGHEVVDFDGRAVIEVPSEGEASEIVSKLNDAAAGGAVALTRAIQSL